MTERIDEFKEILANRLKPKRYFHSLCVMEEAEKLAERYGADKEKAVIAGLLHDITKNYSDEQQIELFKNAGISLDEVEKRSPKLFHAISGAYVVENELGICDEDILNAIRYHTVARDNMSLLEKTIYIADYISADRDYDGVDELRKAAYESMEKVMEEALIFSVTELIEKKQLVHINTVKAWNDIIINKKEREN